MTMKDWQWSSTSLRMMTLIDSGRAEDLKATAIFNLTTCSLPMLPFSCYTSLATFSKLHAVCCIGFGKAKK